MRVWRRLVGVLVLGGVVGWGQGVAPAGATGSIAGHVYLGDTNGPARFASVTVEAAGDFVGAKADTRAGDWSRSGARTWSVRTGMDGGFFVDRLPPGRYVVLAQLAGYVSPLMRFGRDALVDAEPEVREGLGAMMTQVSVEAGGSAPVTVTLVRGAVLRGRVMYDDGAPVGAVGLELERRGKNGDWEEMGGDWPWLTDDEGEYRMAGLAAGEYLVSVQFDMRSMFTTGEYLGEIAGTPMMPGSALTGPFGLVKVHAAGTARLSGAKSVKVVEGEDRGGVDVAVPMGKMHRVTGRVVAESDGHGVDGAHVQVLDAVDRSVLASGFVGGGDGRFALDMVMEGECVLKVSQASDGAMVTEHLEGGATATHWKAARKYVDQEAALEVKGDVAGVVVEMVGWMGGRAGRLGGYAGGVRNPTITTMRPS
jgi:hypothetical protein